MFIPGILLVKSHFFGTLGRNFGEVGVEIIPQSPSPRSSGFHVDRQEIFVWRACKCEAVILGITEEIHADPSPLARSVGEVGWSVEGDFDNVRRENFSLQDIQFEVRSAETDDFIDHEYRRWNNEKCPECRRRGCNSLKAMKKRQNVEKDIGLMDQPKESGNITSQMIKIT